MSTGEKKKKVYAPWGFSAVAILLLFIGPFYFLLWRFPPDQPAWTKAQPRHIEATYDETQPGADDPRVKEGFAAYQAGDFKKAYDIWLPLAEAGNAEAQYRMGRYYDRAEGKQKNIKMAKLYLEKAAAKKHSIAINGLGIMYDSGYGVEHNISKAFYYYKEAAKLCNLVGIFNLGTLYARALPPERDNVSAYKWLFIAEHLGDNDAGTAIKALDKYASNEEKEAGRLQMQAWLEGHACLLGASRK